jgi:hypothetical protein
VLEAMLWMEVGRGGMGNLEGLWRNDQNLYKTTTDSTTDSISCTHKSKQQQQQQQQQAHKRNQTKYGFYCCVDVPIAATAM